MRFVGVAGARPNFMKIKPVLASLEAAGADVALVHTGQHYDEGMSDVFFRELGIRTPDYHLGVGSGSQAEQTARVMVALEPLMAEIAPDVTIVVGDVNSTMAAAIVAAKAGVRVAHVEAGLRSRDWTMPEEINRVVTDRLSDVLLAPSPDAVLNLEREGYRSDQIHLVGNVMVDTLIDNLDRALRRSAHERFGLVANSYALTTLHRPSNVDDAAVLGQIVAALRRISESVPVLLPAHPRGRAAIEACDPGPNVQVVDPVGYLDFLCLEANAALVLTDSGGVQEETTVLGVPCLTLRENTERPVTISEGTNRLVGIRTERITQAALEVLEHGVEKRRPPLWDGRAGERIAGVLLASSSAAPRPTDVVA